MKKALLQFVVALPIFLFSQNEKGMDSIKPIANHLPTHHQTRAVVIGISDYASEGIQDLRFAARDAQIFYDYLRSKAGGEVPAENIRLLTNEKATQAAFLDALYWLKGTAKKGDQAILYFSGHGDVEKQTLWQLGYLLTHGSPQHNYPNNAIELEYLNKILTTMSVGTEARVAVVMDACRAGKLAGSDNLGPSLTAEQLAKRAANEVRILSCKPDQLSLEGEQWGGGRGLFSYFFVNGLKGMADEGRDQQVLLSELENYLKSSVRKSVRDMGITNRQDAVFVGDEYCFSKAQFLNLKRSLFLIRNYPLFKIWSKSSNSIPTTPPALRSIFGRAITICSGVWKNPKPRPWIGSIFKTSPPDISSKPPLGSRRASLCLVWVWLLLISICFATPMPCLCSSRCSKAGISIFKTASFWQICTCSQVGTQKRRHFWTKPNSCNPNWWQVCQPCAENCTCCNRKTSQPSSSLKKNTISILRARVLPFATPSRGFMPVWVKKCGFAVVGASCRQGFQFQAGVEIRCGLG